MLLKETHVVPSQLINLKIIYHSLEDHSAKTCNTELILFDSPGSSTLSLTQPRLNAFHRKTKKMHPFPHNFGELK